MTCLVPETHANYRIFCSRDSGYETLAAIWADGHSSPTLRAYDTLGTTWEDIGDEMLIGTPDRNHEVTW